ncbi:biotin transporter BioY [Leucobacter sp. CSA2]|uniref:Biotin transporter BioY n=1 Tax=Leucobacter edaphi TaxID=2796472 RepID=A0A934UWW2_9MICO|nr:biotin transporter BioY [Leucobacter edaphi]MBK0422104.1 biotin transporter BioY [Leucobacter edaphi]
MPASESTSPARPATAQDPQSAPRAASRPARRRRGTATDLALIATFAALLAVCAILPAISVGPVPITLQTLAVMLTGAVLGARRGFLSVALYLALGAIGLPIFTGGAAGLAPFAGPSVGYLVAFPFAAAATGFIVERLPRRRIATSIPLVFLAGLAASFIFIHPLGILGMSWRLDLTLQQAFLADLVFWPGDVIKNLLMAIIATAVHRAFPSLLPLRAAQRTSSAAPLPGETESSAARA